ncbi:MAG: hypothetical protein AAB442_01705 [Patescibacteria group bacterium]
MKELSGDNPHLELLLKELSACMRACGANRATRHTMFAYTSSRLVTRFGQRRDAIAHAAHSLKALHKLLKEKPPAEKFDDVAIRLALVFAWAESTPKESAAFAQDEVRNFTAGERTDLPEKVFGLVATINGCKPAATPEEHYVSQAGLRAYMLEHPPHRKGAKGPT